MAETSIAWADYTFNPWIGCTKVSPACDHCYAEAQNNFYKWNADGWGPHAPRRRTSAANWRKPLAWDRKAAAEGVRRRVFCASLADVFDNHRSIEPRWRTDLLECIRAAPNLDWLLLTKRPQNIAKMMHECGAADGLPNLWLGTTVENQEEANRRIPHLLAAPAAKRFLSVEPLLERVDFGCVQGNGLGAIDVLRPIDRRHQSPTLYLPALDWIIVGGESGPHVRPMDLEWARAIRDQCKAAGTAFFFKQVSASRPADAMIPDDLRIREFPR